MRSAKSAKQTGKIGFWAQVALTFFIVSGGPYGLEAAVGAIGAGGTLALVLLVPLVWALPTTLMVAELTSVFPHQGGFYVWVREVLGPSWGFQEGWWTLCYSAIDLAIYPVLFVTYLSYFWPGLLQSSPWLQWSAGLVFILTSVLVNLRGSRVVGQLSLLDLILVCIPFGVFVFLGSSLGDPNGPRLAFGELKSNGLPPTTWVMGLAIVMWNYTGWDNATTYASEVESPETTIPRSLMWTLGLVTLFYLVPLLIGYRLTLDPKIWGGGSGWPDIAQQLVAPWLGATIAVMALVSCWSLFNSQLLYLARLPQVMAQDGVLPAKLARSSETRGVPVLALWGAAFCAAVFSFFSLGKLAILDMVMYSLGLALEFWTLIWLRRTQPQLERKFRIRLPFIGIVIMSAVPLLVALVVAVASVWTDPSNSKQLAIVLLAAITGFAIAPRVLRQARAREGLQGDPTAASVDKP